MFCTKCGSPNPEGAQFCRNCSAPLPRTAGQESDPLPTPPPPQESYQGYPGGQQAPPSYQPYPGSQSPAGYNPPLPAGASGRAIASMVLSIVSVFTCCTILSVVGLVLGKMELNAIHNGQAPQAGETFAKVGFYLGIVMTVLSVIGYIFYFLVGIASFIGGNH